MYTLYARPGWGSALTEAQLAAYGLPCRIIDVDSPFTSAEVRALLAPLNPLAQLPTLVLPDGTVMTESAAITLHLADATGSDRFVPAPASPHRPAFLRWLIFLVANLYPTFTYADLPERFVDDRAAQPAFRANVDAYAQRLWRIVEAAAGTPHFLGEPPSALDLYIAVMTRWRPNRPWFAEHTPKLTAIALATESHPEFAAVWARNFAKESLW